MARQPHAELEHGAPVHRVAGQYVLSHGVPHEARRRDDGHAPRDGVLFVKHAACTAEVVAVLCE